MPIISTISFPLDIDDLGVPFLILPNTAFLGEMAPLCIVSNLGATPGAARGLPLSRWRASKAHSGGEGSPALSRPRRRIPRRG